MPTYILTSDHLTVAYDDGDVVTVYRDRPDFDNVLEALRAEDWDEIRNLATPAARIASYGGERVSIQDGIVTLDGNPVEGVLINRMLDMASLDLDVEPLALFLVNLYENTSHRAINELYGFLEASNLTITSDGHFLAYKRIKSDYTDIYTGRMDNSIGTVVEMDRRDVDDDKDRTCSKGLHFCGRDYLSSYGTSSNGCRTVVLKINPRDVVSIPSDYNNHKGRACKYEVVGELDHGDEAPLEGTLNTDYDDLEHDFELDDWTPEDEMDEDGGVRIDDPNAADLTFPSRQAARDYTRSHPDYVVRDRGPNHPNRWYVATRN